MSNYFSGISLPNPLNAALKLIDQFIVGDLQLYRADFTFEKVGWLMCGCFLKDGWTKRSKKREAYLRVKKWKFDF